MIRAKGGMLEIGTSVNLKKNTEFNFVRSILLFLILTGFSNSFLAQNKIAESKQLLKFCLSVNELSEAYSDAVNSQSSNIKSVYDGIIAKETVSTFPLENIELKSYYLAELKNIQRIERIYTMDGAGLKQQSNVVAMMKSTQREMKKVDMFNKAFADYVNGKRYQTDPEFQEGKLMFHKLDQSLQDLKKALNEIQIEIAQIENNSVNVLVEKHKFKNVLLPMNEDLLFLSQLFFNIEMNDESESLVMQIQEKRASLAETMEARSKDVDYLLKEGDKADHYKNFYNRFQSALTKNENELKKEAEFSSSEKSDLRELNEIVLEQLKDSFEKIKGSGSLSQLK